MQHKILVVDDDYKIIEFITNSFSGTENSILAATNGTTAFEIAKKEQPHLIILDWQMPGMDGMQLLTELKKNQETKDILVIIMTGIMADSDHMMQAYKNGAIDFLKKPISYLELIARTNALLELSDFYKNQIEKKNAELSATAIKLIETNAFIDELLKSITENEIKIKNVNSELYHEINSGNIKIISKYKSNLFRQFDEYFGKINPNFYKSLCQAHPDLTTGELKLCSLLRLKLGSKEISSILNLEYDSVRVFRTRLRKKLNLLDEENLVAYLMKF